MKKEMADLVVESLTTMPNGQYYRLILRGESPLLDCRPGQFAEVRIDQTDVLLRRPISIHFVDKERNEMWLLIQKAGKGTTALSSIQRGNRLNLVYPLGNGFNATDNDYRHPLLVGGGVGVAPLLMLGAAFRNLGVEPTFLLGARKALDLNELDEYEKFGRVFLTTEDGSLGEKGFVTQHSVLSSEKFDGVFACGPTPMMKAIAQYAASHDIPCEVSLENRMACGIGACLCCVEDTRNGHQRVCADGPVFNINDLKWQI
ncbi:MAG: dihydroorotate dehydrogenase electron transfer subunit [Paludibacteraceae bacterium]|nr:dihydroorotate dehydrogenase electron transfer subunit [Paludibacteraceae bacterium]